MLLAKVARRVGTTASAAPRTAAVVVGDVLDVVLVAHLLDLLLRLLCNLRLLLRREEVDLGVLALQGRAEADLLYADGAQDVRGLAVVCACQLYS